MRSEGHFDSDQNLAHQAIYWRDEILQVMYWIKGEGIAVEVAPDDLLRFLETDPGKLGERLDQLVEDGYLDPVLGGGVRYRLSALGIEEGRRRFLDEFAPFLGRETHSECGDPECACHTSGEECSRLQGRQGTA